MAFFLFWSASFYEENFESSCHLNVGEKILSIVVGIVRFLDDKPLDFHDKAFSLLLSVFKI